MKLLSNWRVGWGQGSSEEIIEIRADFYHLNEWEDIKYLNYSNFFFYFVTFLTIFINLHDSFTSFLRQSRKFRKLSSIFNKTLIECGNFFIGECEKAKVSSIVVYNKVRISSSHKKKISKVHANTRKRKKKNYDDEREWKNSGCSGIACKM